MAGLFAGTIEGNIANGIIRFLKRNPENLFCDGLSESGLCDITYEEMDAEAWLNATNTDAETFAYICSHDPKQMFELAFSIAMLQIKMELMQGNDNGNN